LDEARREKRRREEEKKRVAIWGSKLLNLWGPKL